MAARARAAAPVPRRHRIVMHPAALLATSLAAVALTVAESDTTSNPSSYDPYSPGDPTGVPLAFSCAWRDLAAEHAKVLRPDLDREWLTVLAAC